MKIQCVDRCEGQATIRFTLEHGVATQSINGIVRGPFCQRSRTLPSNHRVESGRAVVVDPCFWTPKLPFLYEVQLQHETPSGIESVEFQFGIRWCVTDDSNIRLDGKCHVVRAVAPKGPIDLDAVQASSASLLLHRYDAALCKAASEQGVMVVCLDLLSDVQAEEAQQYPALQFARETPALSTDILPLAVAPTRHKVCLTEESAVLQGNDYAAEPPRFLLRRGVDLSVSEMRRECDQLQRDYAKFGQFAGYLIDSEP